MLTAPQQVAVEHRGGDQLGAQRLQLADLRDEPRVHTAGLGDLLHRSAQPQRQFDVIEPAFGRGLQPGQHLLDITLGVRGRPEAGAAGLQRPHHLAERLDEVAAQRHCLTDGFHRGGQGGVGAGEFLEREPRRLDHDVVQGGFEAGRGFLGDVVDDLVEGVTDGQLGGDLGDREAGGLGCQRAGPGYPRVHLDDDQPAVARVDRELDVAAAGVHADLAQDRDAQIAHPLVFPVGQRHGRRDRDRVAGVHAHRVDVLDRAHHHHVVVAVAHQLELEFLPAVDRFLDQHVGAGRSRQPGAGHPVDLVGGVRHARAQPAHGEARPHHDRQAEFFDRLADLVHGETHSAAGGFTADLGDDVLEPLPVLAALDGVEIGADELDAVALQHPVLVQRDRGVERGLPTQSGQQRVDLVAALGLLGDHPLDERRGDGLDVGVVGVLGVGHDGGRVGVDQADLQSLGAQHPARLGAGVVELAGLPDDDRPRADHQDVAQVGATRH